MREITFRVIILSIVLTTILAASNAYLALKLGILTSTSIPAAILSMGLLRKCKNASILEHNAIQTAASAGEAVAGGIVYTIPALVMLGYWDHFDYWTNFMIAFLSGSLGVFFSIPLRRLLVHDQTLRFPEAQAIASLLLSKSDVNKLRTLVHGGAIGAVVTFLQTGVHLIAVEWKTWFIARGALFHIGIGFSPTMIGAGFLIGYDMVLSMALGAILSWFIAFPLTSVQFPALLQNTNLADAASFLFSHQLRYLGIGAMLTAGFITLIMILRPLINNIRIGLLERKQRGASSKQRQEKDIPLVIIFGSVVLMTLAIGWLFWMLFPTLLTGLPLVCILLYLVIIGFIFSIVTAYFSGMVGVSASPGSAIVIAGILFSALLLTTLIPDHGEKQWMHTLEAMTIVMGSILTGIAAIANDNSQDLKVGQLVGATPWKQECMLLLGVGISSLIIPSVMQVLFQAYGIGEVLPHPGMDPHKALPAPTAAMMMGLAEAFFREGLAWTMMLIGGSIIGVCLLLRKPLKLSLLGVAIGMYLPLTTTVPLWIGGFAGYLIEKRAKKNSQKLKQLGAMIACGLIVGSTLMEVVLAIPLSLG